MYVKNEYKISKMILENSRDKESFLKFCDEKLGEKMGKELSDIYKPEQKEFEDFVVKELSLYVFSFEEMQKLYWLIESCLMGKITQQEFRKKFKKFVSTNRF